MTSLSERAARSALATAMLLAAPGCQSDTAAPDQPATSSINVVTSTGGQYDDWDGYRILLDGVDKGSMEQTGSTAISVTAGTHIVELGDIADHCAVTGPNPLSVTTTTGSIAPADFHLVCGGPAAGQIMVAERTPYSPSHSRLFSVRVDGSAPKQVMENHEVTFSALKPGPHMISLRLPAGCSLLIIVGHIQPNPATVQLPADAGAFHSFQGDCD